MQKTTRAEIPIPGTLNLIITAIAVAVAGLSLWMAAHAGSFWGMLLWALVFSYVGNTIFSLLHEAVHRIYHANRSINDLCGQLLAAFFPTGFFFQRAFHLGHHRRNRTDVEMFDMYNPGDSRLLKRLQLYTVLLGFYWTSAPIGGVLYLISPKILSRGFFRSQDPRLKPMSMDAMLSGLDNAKPSRIRFELLFTVLFQIFLFWALGLTWQSWLLCYWAFAINWGSLQYADHAWSKRDVRNGAWNLKVNPVVRWVFLNYHHHLAHHQHPYVPWIHLDKFIDPTQPQPSHFKIWLQLWRGPTPATEPAPAQLSLEFEKVISEGI